MLKQLIYGSLACLSLRGGSGIISTVFAAPPSCIADQVSFIDAVANTGIDTITLCGDIDLSTKIIIGRDLTIDGNGHKLSLANTAWSGIPDQFGNNSNWGNFIINIYQNADVIIRDTVFEGGAAALQVQSNNVVVENISIINPGFGGISVRANTGSPRLSLEGDFEYNGDVSLPAIWIDGQTINSGFVTNNSHALFSETEYTTGGKAQLWFSPIKAPHIVSITNTGEVTLSSDGSFTWTVQASGSQLFSLEIDHRYGNHGQYASINLPEFTVYASGDNPYGSTGAQSLFETAGLTAKYNTTTNTWTLTFAKSLVEQMKHDNVNDIAFYIVLTNEYGQTFGSMSPTTPDNTFYYTFKTHQSSGGGGGGGSVGQGGGIVINPNIDTPHQKDSNDNTAKDKAETTETTNTLDNDNTGTTENYDPELTQAYNFAKEAGITTMGTMDEARLDDNLTRAEFAKMISHYAITVLGYNINESNETVCEFSDLTQTSEELASYVVTACKLGIMGVNVGGLFQPNNTITRAEITTIVSRLYGWAEDGEPYYIHHLAIMRHKGFITIDDPSIIELRGNVFIMLERISKSNNQQYK